jgi:hypothetical protein
VTGKLTDAQWNAMPDSKKVRVYAGGEVRTVTAGSIKRERRAKRRKDKKR